jgi:hypothetical protein
MGVDEAGSSSGVLEVMVKDSARKSISVIVWYMWFDRCDGAVLILRGLSTLSFIPRKSELNTSELGTRLRTRTRVIHKINDLVGARFFKGVLAGRTRP